MRALILACAVMVTFGFIACGANDGGGVAAPGAPPPVVVTGTPVPTPTCMAGQVYVAQYGCLNQYSCQAGYGWVPGENRCVPGTATPTPTALISRFYSSLASINRTTFEKILQLKGLCNPYQGWLAQNWGSYNCANWSQTGYVIVTSQPNGANAVITIAAGRSSPTTWDGANLYTGGGVIGFEDYASVVPYNNSAGFAVVAQDGIRIIVDQGNMSSSASFTAHLLYQGVEIATLNMTRIN